MRATVALVAYLIAAQTPPTARHWARGNVIHVWVDPDRAPSDGAMLVERAMRTWTRAAEGRFTLEKTTAGKDAAVRVHFMAADYRYGVTAPPTTFVINAQGRVAVSLVGSVTTKQLTQVVNRLRG